MLKFKATAIAVTLACMTMGSTAVLAGGGHDDDDDDDYVINASMTVRTDTQPSGSGDTILANCGASSGKQTATVKVEQDGGTSKAKFKIRNARPDTVYTVWLRMKGDVGGVAINPNGSPLTNGGATPLAPGSDLPTLISNSPGNNPAGTPNPVNGFTTDGKGNANWTVHLDFPVQGGAYPFNAVGSTPTAIVDPTAANVNAGFLFRVISHCTDNAGHGLSPAVREAWFQYP